MSPDGERTLPWALSDARSAVTGGVVATGLLGWGWWVTSGTAKAANAVVGIALGVVAAVIVAGTAVSWVAAGRRAVGLRRQEVMSHLETSLLTEDPSLDEATVALVVLPGSTRYHRADCLLVRDKRVTSPRDPRGTHAPCEMCQP